MADENKIPLFRTWRQWYAFVLIVLGMLILFFVWFTKLFA